MPTPPTMRAGERRPFTTERAGERKQFKPKPWSHQHDLENAKGRRIRLTFKGRTADSEDFVTGTLLAADQFSLKLAHSNQSVLTYYKHDIRSHEIL